MTYNTKASTTPFRNRVIEAVLTPSVALFGRGGILMLPALQSPL